MGQDRRLHIGLIVGGILLGMMLLGRQPLSAWVSDRFLTSKAAYPVSLNEHSFLAASHREEPRAAGDMTTTTFSISTAAPVPVVESISVASSTIT